MGLAVSAWENVGEIGMGLSALTVLVSWVSVFGVIGGAMFFLVGVWGSVRELCRTAFPSRTFASESLIMCM